MNDKPIDEASYACPRCGKETKFALPLSLLVSQSVDERKKELELRQLHCFHCKALLNDPFRT